MGLNNNINNIARELEAKNARALTKSEQKQQEAITRERIKNIFFEQVDDLFSKVKNKKDLDILTTNILKQKAKNIDFIKNNYFNKYDQKLTKNDINYLSNNYYNFIIQIKKQYDFIFKIEEDQQKESKTETPKTEAPKSAGNAWNKFYNIFKTIIIILLIPIVFIGSILLECCKASSKKRR